jgi:hypothetical protein
MLLGYDAETLNAQPSTFNTEAILPQPAVGGSMLKVED